MAIQIYSNSNLWQFKFIAIQIMAIQIYGNSNLWQFKFTVNQVSLPYQSEAHFKYLRLR